MIARALDGSETRFAPKAKTRVRTAGPEDDAAIRALLRSRAMDGMIRVAMTRDPDTRIAAEIEGDRHTTFVVYDASGELVGTGSRSVRSRWFRGRRVRIGYLGQLRVRERGCGIKALREGYARLRRERGPDEATFDLTAIVSDNSPARRLLERGLPGLPRYTPLGRIETLIIPTSRARESSARRPTASELVAFLEREQTDFAPVWTEADFDRLRGLSIDGARVIERDAEIVAAGVLWDQRAFKQTIVDGYAPWLGALRPIVNVGLATIGQPRLPRAGSTLAMAYLACFAAKDEPSAFSLIESVRGDARGRGIEQVVLTLHDDHPLRDAIRRRFAARPYHSELYAVSWPDEPLPRFDATPYVEAALL